MDPGFPAGLPALLLAAAAMGLCAPALDTALRRQDGERLFWVGLTGGLTVVAAIAWAGLAAPGAGAVVGLLALCGSAGVWYWVDRRHRARKRARVEKIRRRRIDSLARRREAILLEWGSYELDPWKGAEFPGLTDVREKETSQLARAAREAMAAHEAAGSVEADDAAVDRYGSAVDELEAAWERARDAARRRAD
ncbi:hypothetical protein ITX31_11300 [Arthrobacter gandavensis]|uniref:hypothetical protein n=1 Tax=Arthrobacter gandavensis TaxID=169960 RepID=UPI00188F089A|nr:hypothetical protein [Arthrobacter gandavensis]MBF4994696.1 hypothetical protein [Arthrobacter gandavensis]